MNGDPVRYAVLMTFLMTLFFAGASRVKAAGDVHLSLTAPTRYHPDLDLPIRIELRDEEGRPCRWIWDAEASISVSGAGASVEPETAHLYNGMGSATLALQGDAQIQLTVQADGMTAELTLDRLSWETVAVDADLSAPAVWRPGDGVIHVTSDIRIPAFGEPETPDLVIEPGTVVIIDPECSISVDGHVECRGTAESPILITSADEDPWGEIAHHNAEEPYPLSRYEYTFFTDGGDSSGAGHTGRGPVVRIEEARVSLLSSSLMDNYGKCIWAEDDGHVLLEDCLLTRSIMGMEVGGIDLSIDGCFFLEFIGDDDNDGLYMHSGGDMQVRDSVFARGTDEGIDTLGSSPLIEDCIIRNYTDKGISAFSGTTTVRRCLIVDCHDEASGDEGKGISAKGDGAVVNIENCTLANNDISFQTRIKDGDPDDDVCMNISNTIAWGAAVGVDTEYDPEYVNINIAYSDVGGDFVTFPEETVYPGEGNLNTDPLFVASGAHDFQLQPASPCIDAGDPGADLDPDGTRRDMGAFPLDQSTAAPLFMRGFVNGDMACDLSDAITLLLFLFDDMGLGCADAADVNDDGALDLADAITLLTYLFADGLPPDAPFNQCGTDPTEDALGCEAPAHCQ